MHPLTGTPPPEQAHSASKLSERLESGEGVWGNEAWRSPNAGAFKKFEEVVPVPSEARSPKPKTRAAAVKRADKSDQNKRRYAATETKKVIIDYLKNGMSIRQALKDTGYSAQSYSYYRRSDPDFRERVDDLLQKRKLGGIRVTKEGDTQMSFPEFCEEYLGTRLFNHHLQWVDLLEGEDPRGLHPNQVYEKGMPENILVNTPPEHAKSTTLTVNYVTYKICMDPNIRIIIVSKTQEMAKRFLRAVKDRLSGSNVAYDKLQAHFAPEGGFTANSAAWTADCIYLSSDLRDSGEPSPTVQALGIKGQIYGSRADLILMDDCVDSGNAHDYEKQISWIQNEVTSRLAYPGGRLLLIGTRLAPVDLYSEIRKPEWYGEEESPWTYLTQPAVLEFAEDPEDWVTLWPKTNRPPVSMTARAQVEPDEEGLYPMWPGEALRRKRAKMSPRNWSMVYMQDQVSDLAVFPIEKVNALIDGMRAPGVMSPGAPGHRKHGMNGLYIVGGFDPAMTGNSAAVVIGLDRDTGERWLLDCWTQGHLVPDDIRNKIKEWTTKYRINEWRIEKNAMNLMVTQDREIREFLARRGCILKEHFTGSNKWDTNFGVASMTTLLEGWDKGKPLLRLPRKQSEGIKALVEQLATWFPDTKAKTDCVMALWFAEIRCRELVEEEGHQVTHLENKYASERSKEGRLSVDLDYMASNAMQAGVQGWMRVV